MIAATVSFDMDVAGIMQKAIAGVSEGITEAARLIAEEAVNTVAVDKGDLRDSIEAEQAQVNGNIVEALVTAGTDHAFFVEYGTGIRGANTDPSGNVHRDPNWPGMAAQPYVRPALDTKRSDVLAAVAEGLNNAL